MEPERTPAQAEHHRAVGVSENLIHLCQPELSKPGGEPILKQKALLCSYHLPRCPAASLTGLQSPWSPPATDTATFGAPLRAKENLSDGMNWRSADTQRKC